MQIKDSVVIITGATSGIGESAAWLFAEKGARVVLAARTESKLKMIQKQLGENSLAVTCDVKEREQVKNLVKRAREKFGGVDILINNAGVGCAGAIESVSDENARSVMELNVLGPLLTMQQVIPVMKENGGGLIMNVSSMITKTCTKGSGAYRASKCALDALSEAARVELGKHNIRVTTVYPGLTDTDFFSNTLGNDSGGKASASLKRRMRTPRFVAERILDGARKEPRIVYMGVKSRLGAFAYSVAPVAVEYLLNRKNRG
ncbi:MAG: SDR family NAD(P)-dependent oxidoreductase [Chitinispirillaceae bacterium]